jgi:AcrR family transcriptional regulator
METTGIDREQVLDAAMRLIERDGANGLTMRRLANELGVAPTAIYWHVGKRQDLIAALVDRMLGAFEQIRPRGRIPARRVASMLAELRASLVRHYQLIWMP